MRQENEFVAHVMKGLETVSSGRYTVHASMIRLCVLFLALLLCLTQLAEATQASAGEAEALNTAQSQFEAGDYSSAIATLEAVATAHPNNDFAHYLLGRCYYEVQDYDTAIKHAKRSTQIAQRNSLYHQWLGRAYGGKAARDRSFFMGLRVQQEFEKAVRLDPSNVRARRDLQQLYMAAPWVLDGRSMAREMAEAIATIDEVEGHLAFAAFYMKGLRDPSLAEDEYRLVLHDRPSYLEPYLEVMEFYEHQGKGQAMMVTIEIAESVAPADPRLLYYVAVASVLTGEIVDTTEERLTIYLASTPERSDWPSHAAANEWLGRLYERRGRLAEAVEQYRNAVQRDSERKEARARLELLENSSR